MATDRKGRKVKPGTLWRLDVDFPLLWIEVDPKEAEIMIALGFMKRFFQSPCRIVTGCTDDLDRYFDSSRAKNVIVIKRKRRKEVSHGGSQPEGR